jgi:hypothetical protein
MAAFGLVEFSVRSDNHKFSFNNTGILNPNAFHFSEEHSDELRYRPP